MIMGSTAQYSGKLPMIMKAGRGGSGAWLSRF
jgi:hypothetical protein